MTKRTFTDKNGNSWEWEETKETQKALKELHNFASKYSSSLYAPHPNLKNENAINSKSTNVV